MHVRRIFWAWAVLLTALVATGACTSRVRPLESAVAAQPQPVEVLVVTLRGAIGVKEAALCQRALRTAAAEGMRVVFRLDHAGGAEEPAADVAALLDAVQASKAPTVALVRGHVRGGAAYLALLCGETFALEGADLGDVAPLPTAAEEWRALLQKDAERERFAALGAEMRARLARKQGGKAWRADAVRLCEGMADRSLELVRVAVRERGVESSRIAAKSELAALQAGGAVVVGQQEITQPVVLTAREAEEAGIAAVIGAEDSLWDDVLRVDRRRIGELEPSWAEAMVEWLDWFQPALLVLGFLLLVLEVKTPGLGLPGVLGTGLLALALCYSYLTGLAEITEILLFFLGLAAIAVEIFVLPGTVVFGASGFLLLVLALILSRQSFVLPGNVTQEEILVANLWHLLMLCLLVLAGSMVLWRILPRIPWFNSVLLAPPQPMPAAALAGAAPARSPLLGRRGRTATVLRPAGILQLGDDVVDVVTRGEFLDAGTEVEVVEVEGNRVVVERLQPRAGERGSTGFVLLIGVVGLALLVAEVFLASFGALSIASAVALISAVFLAFQESRGFGIAMLLGEAIAAPIALVASLRILPRTRVGRALLLQAPLAAPLADPTLAPLLHKTGVAVSPLRPAGFARIENRRIDVVTRGELLDDGCPVRVVEVQGNRVVVARDHDAARSPAS